MSSSNVGLSGCVINNSLWACCFLYWIRAHCLRPGHGDLLKNAPNATFHIIRQINVPQFPIDSLYFGLSELRQLIQYADTAVVQWTTDNKDGVALIRHAQPALDVAK